MRHVLIKHGRSSAEWLRLSVVSMFGKDDSRIHRLRIFPHQPSVLNIQSDICFIADVEKNGTIIRERATKKNKVRIQNERRAMLAFNVYYRAFTS